MNRGIALLVPSRERINNKIQLVNSIVNTAENIENITLYFGIDDDDPEKQNAISLASSFPFIKIVEIHNEGKFLGVGKLWNICAKEAREDILAMIGDDMVFCTDSFDAKILEEFNGDNCQKDNIKMVYCNDCRHGEKIAVNLFVHRKYMEINGYLMREEFMVDFIDIWMQQVLSSLGRIKYRKDILIEHKHWSFRKSTKDSVSCKLRGNQYPEKSQKLWIDLLQERKDEAKRIGDLIGVVPNYEKINDKIPG